MEWKDARPKAVTCAACQIAMEPLGQMPLRAGGTSGGWHLLFGEWADAGERTVMFDVFRCRKCRRVELFDLDLSLPAR